MAGKENPAEDTDSGGRDSPRLRAARYRLAREIAAHTFAPRPGPGAGTDSGLDAGLGSGLDFGPRPARAGDPIETVPRLNSTDDVAERADSLIEDAIARGDFDNLAYSGKPIPGLGETMDPNWWVNGLIRREHLTGLGPPALMLRTEDADLDDRLDAMSSEKMVRETLADFNHRVIDARRQLLGGPPVVTPTRDADTEVDRWRARREAKAAARQESAASAAPAPKHRRFLGSRRSRKES